MPIAPVQGVAHYTTRKGIRVGLSERQRLFPRPLCKRVEGAICDLCLDVAGKSSLSLFARRCFASICLVLALVWSEKRVWLDMQCANLILQRGCSDVPGMWAADEACPLLLPTVLRTTHLPSEKIRSETECPDNANIDSTILVSCVER
jgi:hypothetical protein